MRVSRLLPLTLAAALALAACGGSDDKKQTGPNGLEKTNLTIGLLPIADAAAVPLAQAKGYFKEEGLTVKLETVQGGATATKQVMAGSLDVSQTNYTSVFLARENGTKVKVVADAAEAKPNLFNLMVRKDSPVKTAADLKGKKIAVNTLRNVGELAVAATLKAQGVAAKEVKFVEYPFPNMGPALQKGDIDAAWVTEPFITTGQSKQGLRTVADTMTGPTADLPIAGWQVSEKFAKENPKTVAAFQRAVLKGQKLAAENRREVQDIVPTYTKIDKDSVKVIVLPGYPTTLNPQRIQRVADLMKEFGYLRESTDAKTILVGSDG
ncbi:ABC transporter substrate-binding protein [Actinomadura hibisca]|uniref:ABC transporter substrate-binding protein n=1 Tax=Actinomadura hibisca TaxID=68565 RepID=UPI00082E5801|nr:ABC transporter substrate-binding protein [Actinomadura hibisca]